MTTMARNEYSNSITERLSKRLNIYSEGATQVSLKSLIRADAMQKLREWFKN